MGSINSTNDGSPAAAAPCRRLDIVYAGPLRPPLGGASVLGTLLLNRLAERGHRIRTISPLTPDFFKKPIQHGLHQAVEHTWFEMPHIDVHLGYLSEVNPPGSGRDLYFQIQSQRVRDLLAIDTDTLIAHLE